MGKLFIIFAIAIVSTSCVPSKSLKSNEKSIPFTQIALGMKIGSPAQTDNSSNKKTQYQGVEISDRKIIYRVQEKLIESGYNPGPLDGIWGPKTRTALNNFQQDYQLPVTDKLNQETFQKLMQTTDEEPKDSVDPVDQSQNYSIMTVAEARQLIDKHIQQNDIEIEPRISYRTLKKDSDSGNRTDVFQGVRFDNNNYLVFALCEPVYSMEIPAKDLPDKLAKQNIEIPDDVLSFTFNGILYSTVDLQVERELAFSHTIKNGFMNNSDIPRGGYHLLMGDLGMNLGNTFIFYRDPLMKSFTESWRSQPNLFTIKISLPNENGILLHLSRN